MYEHSWTSQNIQLIRFFVNVNEEMWYIIFALSKYEISIDLCTLSAERKTYVTTYGPKLQYLHGKNQKIKYV